MSQKQWKGIVDCKHVSKPNNKENVVFIHNSPDFQFPKPNRGQLD